MKIYRRRYATYSSRTQIRYAPLSVKNHKSYKKTALTTSTTNMVTLYWLYSGTKNKFTLQQFTDYLQYHLHSKIHENI